MALVNGTGVVNGYQIAPGADLGRADLVGANLQHANLRHAILRGANLYYADLTDADLSDADLTDADLTGANLTGASLRGANLSGADLVRAILVDANLRGAVLVDANLRGAHLVCVNFYCAKVDPAHVPLIEAACREMLASIVVTPGRTPNPGHGYKYESDLYDDSAEVKARWSGAADAMDVARAYRAYREGTGSYADVRAALRVARGRGRGR